MTEQDPTQPFEAPAAPAPPPPPASPEAPPPAPGLPAAADNAGDVSEPVVAPAAAGRPGRSRRKWAVAGLVTLLVAGAAAAGVLLLTLGPGDPDVLAWTPADSVLYGEARLDLPGDQGTELAKVMSAFPGFDDQASFRLKLSEAMDRLVGEASDGKMSYTSEIEPWFNGRIAASIGELPKASDPASARVVLLVGVKDAAKASAWAAKVLVDTGATSTTETYNGTTITMVQSPDLEAAGDFKVGYAVVGPVLAAGDLASVKAVIDTGGKTGLASAPTFKEARASLTGDHLGLLYYDYAAFMDALKGMAEETGTGFTMPQSLLDQMPDWVVMTFRADDAAFVWDMRSPHSDLNGVGAESKLPALLPAGTIVLLDGHDLGAQLARMKDIYAEVDEFKDAIGQIDDALSVLGGFDAVTGWIGESAILVTRTGDQVSGGIAMVPTDKAAADRLFSQLKGFVELGGGQAGISVSEEDYKGTTITAVDLSALAPLVGSQLDGEVQLPSEIKLAYAVTDGIVVLGYGTDFIKSVLDAPAAGPLAGDARFAAALQRAGSSSTGLMWLDLTATRELVEGLLPAEAKDTYESDVKPYLVPFDYFISTTVPGSPYDNASLVVHVAGS